MKAFRERNGIASSFFYSGELADANNAAWEFITSVIERYGLKKENGYHTETRCMSLANVNINDDTNGHWSDNEIVQILDNHGEVVAFSYLSRNDMNCAEVVMVDLLQSKKRGEMKKQDGGSQENQPYLTHLVTKISDQDEPKNKDLEQEINDYLIPLQAADIKHEPFTQLERCARHFAEWNREKVFAELGYQINLNYNAGYKRGARDKESEMMKNVVLETTVFKGGNGFLGLDFNEIYEFPEGSDLKEGDKVSFLMIKEEEIIVGNEIDEEIKRHINDCLDVKFPTLDIESIKRDVEYTARHFANWQKKQMMKDAITTVVINGWEYGKDEDHAQIPTVHIKGGINYSVGDKVKVIIIKEE